MLYIKACRGFGSRYHEVRRPFELVGTPRDFLRQHLKSRRSFVGEKPVHSSFEPRRVSIGRGCWAFRGHHPYLPTAQACPLSRNAALKLGPRAHQGFTDLPPERCLGAPSVTAHRHTRDKLSLGSHGRARSPSVIQSPASLSTPQASRAKAHAIISEFGGNPTSSREASSPRMLPRFPTESAFSHERLRAGETNFIFIVWVAPAHGSRHVSFSPTSPYVNSPHKLHR